MSTNTPNYNLEKPNEEEFYDVNVQNGNMDKIDSALKTLAVEVASGVTQEDLTAIDTKLDGINQGVDEINGKSDQIKQGVDNISAQIANKNASKVMRSKVYTSNGTFTAPAGVTDVYITGGGGGGGGAASSNTATGNGSSGGVTSFGALLSLSGGGGGSTLSPAVYYATPAGGPGGSEGGVSQGNGIGGAGGGSGWYSGGSSGVFFTNTTSKMANGAHCSGGAGVVAPGGGGAAFVIKHRVPVTPLTNYSVTIGAGGKGGTFQGSGYTTIAGNGGDGILTVEWWE